MQEPKKKFFLNHAYQDQARGGGGNKPLKGGGHLVFTLLTSPWIRGGGGEFRGGGWLKAGEVGETW